MSFNSSLINLDDITPEIAAFVVRNYLLPMFESDFKKSQRQKRNGEFAGLEGAGSTVYSELKLSEKLQLEIYSLREEKEGYREQVEALTLKNRDLEKKILELNLSISKTKSHIEKLRSQKSKAEQEKK